MSQIQDEQAALIRKSFVRVLARREEFSYALYDRLFSVVPEARSLFSSDMVAQREKLVATLAFVVNGASNLGELTNEVRELGRRHRAYGVEMAHYGILRGVLVDTLAEIVGNEFTPDVAAAWAALYDELAEAMMAPDNPGQH